MAVKMYDNKNVVEQLQRYYSLWKDSICLFKKMKHAYNICRINK